MQLSDCIDKQDENRRTDEGKSEAQAGGTEKDNVNEPDGKSCGITQTHRPFIDISISPKNPASALFSVHDHTPTTNS